MKIDLHVHTEFSPGCSASVEKIIRQAEAASLDAVAFTDYGSLAAYDIARSMTTRIVVIPAMEIRAAEGIHIIGLFLRDIIPTGSILDVVEAIHNQGGLAMVPHPYRFASGLLYKFDKKKLPGGNKVGEILRRIDLIEVFNGRCPQANIVDTAKFLDCYGNIPCVAGSDAYVVEDVGKAYLDLAEVKENTREGLKEALIISPRTMRYEVFDIESGGQEETETIEEKQRLQLFRSRNSIFVTIQKSIRVAYERSVQKLNRVKKGKSEAAAVNQPEYSADSSNKGDQE
jgi:predicted metal-dependent phosphoesterase TrpH